MEHKDRLDELLQRKFAEDDPENRFAFREEHWLEAKALIEADERRRRGLWWWLFGALGLGAVALCWLLAGRTEPPRPASAETTRTPGETATGRKAQPELGDSVAGTPRIRPGAGPALGTTAPERAAEPTGTERPASRSIKRYGRRQNLAQPAAGGTPYPAEPTMPNRPPPISRSPGLPKIVPEGTSDTRQLNTPNTPAGYPAARPATERGARLLSPDLLPTRMSVLPAPAHKPATAPPAIPPPVAETARYRDWQFRFGLTAAGATRSGALRDEKPGLAAAVALELQRKNNPWSFHTGLQWRWRRGWAQRKTPGQEEAEQLTYSFGYTFDLVHVGMTGGQWLELPLSVRYHRRSFAAELGIAPQTLLMVQGKETRIRQTSLAPDPHTGVRTVRLTNAYFFPTGLELFGGLHWALTGRLELGLRAYYQPTAFLQRPVDQPAPKTRPFWLDASAHYYLFRIK